MRAKQQEIIATLGVKPNIQPVQEIEKRSQFLANYLGGTGLNGFVLGISGGQDSLLAGIITQRAVDICNKNNREAYFHTMLLPYGIQHDRADAELAVKTIKSYGESSVIEHDIDIKPSVDTLVANLYTNGQEISDFDKGNIKARIRMMAQYAIAGACGLLVVGTDHAAESVTGFFTKFGDGAADIMPLSGLTKRQGRAMLEVLNIPESLLNKTPTADLLDNNPIQPDETELGISYTEIDDYLEGKTISPKVAKIIENFYEKTQHKRNLPIQYRDNK
ncbi:ammonia-dependent NAD(+) synthetase [Candidatus Nanosynbacter sp. TM7-074]|uniref:NH(3)-dependent NAD(+) synthetase n=1 Tax=Candidatus Nanosynbacter sp. TM7-074 TaxID=3158573 RepID=A0AB39JAD8_9BACT